MRVNGQPINDYHFRPQVATITHTMPYELEQARLYAGLSPLEFDALPGTPEWVLADAMDWRTKAHILLLYRMSTAIPAVAQDAANRQMERDSKLRKFRK